MFRISRFAEMMKPLSRGAFDRVIQARQADKHSKGFGCWQHLQAMVYAQFAGIGGLRELETGFNSQRTHHYHLDCQTIHRSTLSDANANRDPGVFAEMAALLMQQSTRRVRQQAGELLYLLDSTSFTLKGLGFDAWTHDHRTRNTQGMKLHLLYAAQTQVPVYQRMTAANVNDIEVGREIPIEANAMYVFDKGYCDYNWWAAIDDRGGRFVTRFKRNAHLQGVQTLPIAVANRDTILLDQIVKFANKHPRGGRKNHYRKPLRCVTVARDNADPLILATNDLTSGAEVIAQRYKDRWQIELFFKWIKQHLKIKRFLGRSENAVRIQILTALISYLLLALHRHAHGLKTSLYQLFNEVRATLFQRPGIDAELYRRRRDRLLEAAARQSVLFV